MSTKPQSEEVERTTAEKVRVLAERVMGWHIGTIRYEYPGTGKLRTGYIEQVWSRPGEGSLPLDGWNPYESISDAWMLVEKLKMTPQWDAFIEALAWNFNCLNNQKHHPYAVVSRVVGNLSPTIICESAYQTVSTETPSAKDPDNAVDGS